MSLRKKPPVQFIDLIVLNIDFLALKKSLDKQTKFKTLPPTA